jgi:hypothetical protein
MSEQRFPPRSLVRDLVACPLCKAQRKMACMGLRRVRLSNHAERVMAFEAAWPDWWRQRRQLEARADLQ